MHGRVVSGNRELILMEPYLDTLSRGSRPWDQLLLSGCCSLTDAAPERWQGTKTLVVRWCP